MVSSPLRGVAHPGPVSVAPQGGMFARDEDEYRRDQCPGHHVPRSWNRSSGRAKRGSTGQAQMPVGLECRLKKKKRKRFNKVGYSIGGAQTPRPQWWDPRRARGGEGGPIWAWGPRRTRHKPRLADERLGASGLSEDRFKGDEGSGGALGQDQTPASLER
eukprot:1181308-Prorocentrum_minimum.AAC.2